MFPANCLTFKAFKAADALTTRVQQKAGKVQSQVSTPLGSKDHKQITEADWKFRQNAAQFARQGYSIAGAIPVALLERTADGDLRVGAMSGSVRCVEKSVSMRPGFVVAAQGSVGLTCQSCGADFDLPVDTSSTIHVAHDAAELASWEDEAFECIEGNEKTSALELVEDELLLAVPFIPRCLKCEADPALREA